MAERAGSEPGLESGAEAAVQSDFSRPGGYDHQQNSRSTC